MREVIDLKNANLVVLIESDPDACRYFLSLPENVRAELNENPGDIATLNELQARADALMWGG